MQLRTIQHQFKKAILNPALAQGYGKKWLNKFRGVSAEERLGVYRSNIFNTLTKVLKVAYPLCEKMMGEQGFKQLASQYIHYKFPTEACLDNYGNELPAFIKTIPKLIGNISYLSDMASYEWLCHEAFHAPIEPTVTRDDLEMLNKSKFSEFPLVLTQACGVIQSEFPLLTLVENMKQNPHEPITYVKGTHYFLVYRFLGETLEEEISDIFYKSLRYLQETTQPSIMDLSHFMISENHPEEVGPFIHFLFNRNLIQKM